jgi:hypothetical protein
MVSLIPTDILHSCLYSRVACDGRRRRKKESGRFTDRCFEMLSPQISRKGRQGLLVLTSPKYFEHREKYFSHYTYQRRTDQNREEHVQKIKVESGRVYCTARNKKGVSIRAYKTKETIIEFAKSFSWFHLFHPENLATFSVVCSCHPSELQGGSMRVTSISRNIPAFDSGAVYHQTALS